MPGAWGAGNRVGRTLAFRNHAVQRGVAAPPGFDLDDSQALWVGLSRDRPLQGDPQRLRHYETGERRGDDERNPTQPPGRAAAAGQGDESGDTTKESGGQHAGSAVRMDGETPLAAAQSGQGLLGGLGHRRPADVAEQEEAGWIGASDERRPRVARTQEMDGGVLEGVVTAQAGEDWAMEEGFGHRDKGKVV